MDVRDDVVTISSSDETGVRNRRLAETEYSYRPPGPSNRTASYNSSVGSAGKWASEVWVGRGDEIRDGDRVGVTPRPR